MIKKYWCQLFNLNIGASYWVRLLKIVIGAFYWFLSLKSVIDVSYQCLLLMFAIDVSYWCFFYQCHLMMCVIDVSYWCLLLMIDIDVSYWCLSLISVIDACGLCLLLMFVINVTVGQCIITVRPLWSTRKQGCRKELGRGWRLCKGRGGNVRETQICLYGTWTWAGKLTILVCIKLDGIAPLIADPPPLKLHQ